METITFIILVLYEYLKKTEVPSKPFRLWKFSYVFIEMTLVFQTLIVLFFWLILIHFTDFSRLSIFQRITQVIDHILPCLFIVGEVLMNGVRFQILHSIPMCSIMLLYIIFNAIISAIRGEPIYEPLDPKSIVTWIVGIVLIAAVFGI